MVKTQIHRPLTDPFQASGFDCRDRHRDYTARLLLNLDIHNANGQLYKIHCRLSCLLNSA